MAIVKDQVSVEAAIEAAFAVVPRPRTLEACAEAVDKIWPDIEALYPEFPWCPDGYYVNGDTFMVRWRKKDGDELGAGRPRADIDLDRNDYRVVD